MAEQHSPSPALRFGVMCSGTTVRAWQARCLESLAKVPGVDVALLIVDDEAQPRRSLAQRLRPRPNFVWDAYNNLYVARRSRALRRVDLRHELAGVPAIRCRVETRGRFSQYFSEEDLERIASYRLDFILRFAFGIIRGDILTAARLGIWSFHHDDEERYRGGPPAFWELVEGAGVTGAVLQRLTERLDGGIVLHKGSFPTVAHSYVRNTDEVHFGSAEWPAKVCRDIQHGAGGYVDGGPSRSNAPIYRKPSNARMTAFLVRLAVTFVRTQARRLLVSDQWNVGIVHESIERFLDPDFRPAVRWWPRSRDRSTYVADPFGVVADGRRVVLVESYDYRSRIGILEWADEHGGSRDASMLAIEEHASYPFLLQHDGAVYCTPQLARSRGVRLFRSIRFPVEWEQVAVLVPDVRAIDPTVVEHDGRWWLFLTDAEDGPLTKLRVWWADDLLGPWRPHTGNPVKTDVCSARPGGTPFVSGGTLYRPAQDCSRTYGGAIALNRVTRMTPTEYDEEPVVVVDPIAGSGYERGLHTIAAMNGVTLIDGKRHVFSAHATLAEARARIRRLRRH